MTVLLLTACAGMACGYLSAAGVFHLVKVIVLGYWRGFR